VHITVIGRDIGCLRWWQCGPLWSFEWLKWWVQKQSILGNKDLCFTVTWWIKKWHLTLEKVVMEKARSLLHIIVP